MRRLALALLVSLVPALAGVASGAASSSASGVAGSAVRVFHPPILAVNANQSNNWSGYNQGALEKSVTFHSVSGEWVVPTASAHKSGEAEYSSSWVGIGGGCVDAGCNVGDTTLIQAGTEQDVNAAAADGNCQTYAWWELIPAPGFGLDCGTYPVRPGDRVHVDIAETVTNSELWKITIHSVTRGWTWTMTV